MSLSFRHRWQQCRDIFVKQSAINVSAHSVGFQGKHVAEHAATVMSGLGRAGFEAYLVGGCVRDALAGIQPKDFDVVTDAEPEAIEPLFRRSRIIGRRFRLVHVYGRRREDVIEVSTFRANSQSTVRVGSSDAAAEHPMVVDDNTFGTIEEDAWRRDFTINALYYNHADQRIVDFTGGLKDIKRRMVRMIGDPAQRFHEDPVRLLRAIRMAAKLGFRIEKKMRRELISLPGLLQHVAPARLYDEVGKLFFTGHAVKSFQVLQEVGYFAHLFPNIHALMQRDNAVQKIIENSMQETDSRYAQGLSLNPGYLFAVLYWPLVGDRKAALMQSGEKISHALPQAIRYSLRSACSRLAIPKRHQALMRAVWSLQYHLEQQRPQRIARLLGHRYCRAAVDFLELRVRAGWQEGQACAQAWRQRVGDRRPSNRSRSPRHRSASAGQRRFARRGRGDRGRQQDS